MGANYTCGPPLPRAVDDNHPAEEVKALYDAWLDSWAEHVHNVADSDDQMDLWNLAYQIFGPGSENLMMISAIVKLAAR